MRHVRLAIAAAIAVLGVAPSLALAAGPPYPDPVQGQAVYDTAGVLSDSTIATVEGQIDQFEADTGAEIAVYTQLVEDGRSTAEAEADAMALMDQWGVGRAGVDDGLVILFDLYRSDPCHGQVQLYAGPGFRETWLSNDDRQRIYENDMLPHLRECDVDGALLAAMDSISAVPTFRVLNAVLGIPIALAIFLGTLVLTALSWTRSGRDPVYLDDPSILMPAPPPGLTPAAGAAMREGKVTRRALTAASLELAARGRIAFNAEPKGGLFGGGTPELGIFARDSQTQDPVEQARLARVNRRPMDPATTYLLTRLHAIAGSDGYIEPEDILKLGTHVSTFDSHLGQHLVSEGWYGEAPGRTSRRWAGRAVLVGVLAVVAFIAGVNLPSSGLVLVAISLIASAVVLFVASAIMPARTKAGAVVVAMLEAYRRTLEMTMAQARSMGQVVEASAIPLIEDPDDAVVWGTALGLQSEVEAVLQRSAEDYSTGYASHAWFPLWYASGRSGWSQGGGGGWAPGMMSSSAIPNFGGMMAALGTIGNSPSSSGSGGGGFSGGGSGGGGGGAGGGF